MNEPENVPHPDQEEHAEPMAWNATIEGSDHTVYASKPITETAQWLELCRQISEFVREISGQEVEVEGIRLPSPDFDPSVVDSLVPLRYKPFRFEQMVVKFKTCAEGT